MLGKGDIFPFAYVMTFDAGRIKNQALSFVAKTVA
jgi:hypothetical protein